MAFCRLAAADLPGTSPDNKLKAERNPSVTARRTPGPCRAMSGPSAARAQPVPGSSRCLGVKYLRTIDDSGSSGVLPALLLQRSCERLNARAHACAIKSSFEEKGP